MDLKTEISKGIGAHGMWKQRIVKAIKTGESEWEPKNVELDNLCQFGKWLDSCSIQEKSSQHFVEIKELHSKFHKVAAGILEMALSGKKAEAESAIGLQSEYVSISAELTKHMRAWSADAA